MTDQETIFEYLDELRASGETNMYGAAAYLQRDFGLDSREAMKLTLEWMDTFEERHTVQEQHK